MDKVRVRMIRWLLIMGMLCTTMMVNVGTAPAVKTELYITPDRIPEQPGTLGHVGDEYYIAVNIKEVTDLYGVGFTIRFAPYGETLTASDVMECDFLSEGGTYATAFTYKISVFDGTVKVGITRLDAVSGASGSGTLMTFNFTVTEAGECPIELVDSELIGIDMDGALCPLEHVTSGSFYYGCTADLVNVVLPYGRHVYVGENTTFLIKARNDGDVPLWVKGCLEAERIEDGQRIHACVEPVCIMPGQEATSPGRIWVGSGSGGRGTYWACCSIEYSELYPDLGFHWKNEGAKVKCFTFWVEEPPI